MLGHQYESMQLKSPQPSIAIQSFQEKSDIWFDDEKPSALPSNECDEIRSRRGHRAHRLQGKPQRLKPHRSSLLCTSELVPFPFRKIQIFRSVSGILRNYVGRNFVDNRRRRLSKWVGKGTTSVVPSVPEHSPASTAAVCCFHPATIELVVQVLGRLRLVAGRSARSTKTAYRLETGIVPRVGAKPLSAGSATHCHARRPFSRTTVLASPYSTSRLSTVVTEASGSL
jgi:hypothetical protein